MKWSNVEELNNKCYEKRWLLSLPGAGCSWAKQSGGCYMCNFKAATDKITFGKLLPDFIFSFLYQFGYLSVRAQKPNSIIIFNGGSFFNEDEMSINTQKKIFSFISKNSFIEKIIVESRPEFITEERLSLLGEILGNKKLVVAMGLETKSDKVRSKCINKGFNLKHFEKAAKIINHAGVEILTYVFLKPLYLSENEAIKEAIESIEYAFSIGSSEVDLESAFIVKGTKMEKIYNEGRYRPPWLWSIIEVVSKTAHLGNLHIGGFDDYPPPLAIPFNCKKCSPSFPSLIKEFNQAQQLKVFAEFSCACKNQWLEQLAI